MYHTTQFTVYCFTYCLKKNCIACKWTIYVFCANSPLLCCWDIEIIYSRMVKVNLFCVFVCRNSTVWSPDWYGSHSDGLSLAQKVMPFLCCSMPVSGNSVVVLFSFSSSIFILGWTVPSTTSSLHHILKLNHSAYWKWRCVRAWTWCSLCLCLCVC